MSKVAKYGLIILTQYIVPMPVNKVSSNTMKLLECEDPLQGSAFGEKFKISACTISQFSYSTSNGIKLEPLRSYMPILQAPPMAGFGGKQLINDEGNLSLGSKKCQELG